MREQKRPRWETLLLTLAEHGECKEAKAVNRRSSCPGLSESTQTQT